MSEQNDAKQKLLDGLDCSEALKHAKPDPPIPSKPSELVAEVLDVDLAQQRVNGPSPLYPFMHGLLCGLKLGGL